MYKENQTKHCESGESLPSQPSESLVKIVCDTRERIPLLFNNLHIRGVSALDVDVHKLTEGDYSISGMEDQVFIERKSAADLYGTLFQGRERFERELERVAAKDYKYRYLVIESTPFGFAQYMEFHRNMKQFNSAFSSLMTWAERYKLKIRWCRNPADTADYVARLAIKIYNEQFEVAPE